MTKETFINDIQTKEPGEAIAPTRELATGHEISFFDANRILTQFVAIGFLYKDTSAHSFVAYGRPKTKINSPEHLAQSAEVTKRHDQTLEQTLIPLLSSIRPDEHIELNYMIGHTLLDKVPQNFIIANVLSPLVELGMLEQPDPKDLYYMKIPKNGPKIPNTVMEIRRQLHIHLQKKNQKPGSTNKQQSQPSNPIEYRTSRCLPQRLRLGSPPGDKQIETLPAEELRAYGESRSWKTRSKRNSN